MEIGTKVTPVAMSLGIAKKQVKKQFCPLVEGRHSFRATTTKKELEILLFKSRGWYDKAEE